MMFSDEDIVNLVVYYVSLKWLLFVLYLKW